MEVYRNTKITVNISFCTHKEYTKTSWQAGNASITMSDVAVICRCLPVPMFLRCGAVPVMGFGKMYASLITTRKAVPDGTKFHERVALRSAVVEAFASGNG